MPFLRDKSPRPSEPHPSETCSHTGALYQPGYTHKFCPDCVTWLPDENHPDNQPKDDDALPEV